MADEDEKAFHYGDRVINAGRDGHFLGVIVAAFQDRLSGKWRYVVDCLPERWCGRRLRVARRREGRQFARGDCAPGEAIGSTRMYVGRPGCLLTQRSSHAVFHAASLVNGMTACDQAPHRTPQQQSGSAAP
jgi:hypothetical protein